MFSEEHEVTPEEVEEAKETAEGIAGVSTYLMIVGSGIGLLSCIVYFLGHTVRKCQLLKSGTSNSKSENFGLLISVLGFVFFSGLFVDWLTISLFTESYCFDRQKDKVRLWFRYISDMAGLLKTWFFIMRYV